MKTFEDVIEDFVTERCEAAYQELKETKEYKEVYPKYNELLNDLAIATKLENNKELFDSYHLAEGQISGLQIYSAYQMGVKDAFKIFKLLNTI